MIAKIKTLKPMKAIMSFEILVKRFLDLDLSSSFFNDESSVFDNEASIISLLYGISFCK